MLIGPNGAPYKWNTSTPVPYRYDAGPLGILGNSVAAGLIDYAFQRWSNVATAAITFQNQGLILTPNGASVDINITNFAPILNKTAATGQNQIVFDASGEIFDMLFGENSGIVGFAGPDIISASAPYEIVEASAFLNGAFIDGIAGNGELPLEEFKAVVVHEFGHFINLAHSQVNGNAILSGENILGFGVPPVSSVETMFPVFFAGSASGVTPHSDDIAMLSVLYPVFSTQDPFIIASTGTFTGKIFAFDGATPLNGVNVIARNTSGGAISVFADAVSQISGAFTPFAANGGSEDPDWQGRYFLSGLTPGGDYAIQTDELGPGQFSSQTLVPLPAPEEFYNGANEGSNPALDFRHDIQYVAPVANSVTPALNIVLNREIRLAKYDDSIESVQAVQTPTGASDYFAVRFSLPASVAAPYSVSGIRFFNNDKNTIWPRILLTGPTTDGQPDLLNPIIELNDISGRGNSFLEIDLNTEILARHDLFAVFQFPEGATLAGTGPGIGADESLDFGVISGNLFSVDGEIFDEIAHYNLAVELTLFGPEPIEISEPNETPASATPIVPGSITQGFLSNKSDVDIFSLSAFSGAFVRIDLAAARHGSLLDAVLTLTDSRNRVVARNDDRVPGIDKDPFIELELTGQETYFLAVDNFDHQQGAQNIGGQAFFYELKVDSLHARPRLTHETGTVSFSVWANGIYGDDGTGRGRGFSFLEHGGGTLFSGGFVAASGSRMGANVPSLGLPNGISLVDFEQDSPFQPFVANAQFGQIGVTQFSDGNMNLLSASLGLQVKQTSYSNFGDDFVLIACLVANATGESIENLYLGQFADWDVGIHTESVQRNRGGYDANRSLVYQYENSSNPRDSNWYGIKTMQAASGARVISDLDPADFSSYLSNFDGPGPMPITGDDDFSSFIGSGPFALEPGDSVLVGFAWIAGQGLPDLSANADLAQAAWNDLVVSVQPEHVQIPQEFQLEQNFPNPFNPATRIRYFIARQNHVSLIIYNALGQVVRTLVSAEHRPGFFEIDWDGRNDAGVQMANGLYFYQLMSGERSLARKMILLR